MNLQDLDARIAANLAANLKYLRSQLGLTQAQLAHRGEMPRSTLANIETGAGNPTVSVLARLALALQVSIEELLSTPRAQCQVFPKGTLETVSRARGAATVMKLLPDPVPGMEIDRIALKPGAQLVGIPHRPGTREYLCCESGQLVLWAGGERFVLEAGDVAAFQGDQKHSYRNEGRRPAVGFSVVALVPIAAR